MATSIRNGFRNETAKIFVEDIQFRRNRYYYFLGNIEPWSGLGQEGPSDLPAAFPLTEEYDRKIRTEMAFAKNISANEVSLVIKRNQWVSGTHYEKWDHTISMVNQPFYVVNSSNQVYKCLENGDTTLTPNLSTIQPTGTSLIPIITADGYIWKYMYTIAPFLAEKFGSNDFIPVKQALSDTFYNNGSVDTVAVLAEGSGYTDEQRTIIGISGTTTGTGAVLRVGAVNISGSIVSVIIDDGGTGYTKGVDLVASVEFGASGFGAKFTSTITGGVITGVTIEDGGVGYTPNDVIAAVVGGAELVPVISRTDGSIVDVKITKPGIGYVTAPTLSVSVLPGYSSGTGKYGNANAVLSCFEYQGSIKTVSIVDPGINYPFDTATTITVSGDGEGAIFTPIIIDGKIVDVITENPGSGYSNIILTVNSPSGSGASLSGIISNSDFTTDQSIVEQTTTEGAIYAFKVVNGGSGYTNGQVSVTVNGNGYGCKAIAEVFNGSISKVKIDGENFGIGYYEASVVINDLSNNPETEEEENKAKVYAIMSPIGGHGKDAPAELLCNTVAINSKLQEDLVLQDFRTYGIIKNPRNINTGSKYTEQSTLLVFKVRMENISGLTKDAVYTLTRQTTFNSELYNVTDRYRLIDFVNEVAYFLPLTSNKIIPVGTLTREDNTSIQVASQEMLSYSFMDKYSGRLLYVATEAPFEFSAEQSINLKSYITF